MREGIARWAVASRRWQAAALALAAGGVSLGLGGTAPGAEPASAADVVPHRPNLVLVMADDMRADDLRFAPRLQRLVAEQGVTFENSFSPYPLCSPSRASVLTGQYAHNHGVYSHNRPYGYGSFDDSRTLATSLQEVGYRTGFVGKYVNGYGVHRSRVSGEPSAYYVPNGWDEWHGAISNPGGIGVHGGTYDYLDMAFDANGKIDNDYRGQYGTDVLGDLGVAAVKRLHASGKPFFLDLDFVAPHHGAPVEGDDPPLYMRDRAGRREHMPSPYVPPRLRHVYAKVVQHAAGLPADGGPAEADVSDKPGFIRAHTEPTRAQRRAVREVTLQRAQAIYALDRQVGRLIAQLKREGEWDDTVFVFTSDNGYFLGEHRILEGKVRFHEPSLRVPMLITGPGLRDGGVGGHRRYDPITTVDLTATLLDLADADPPRRPDGQSRVATLYSGDRGWSTGIVTESLDGASRRHKRGFHDPRGAIGVRTARYSMSLYRHRKAELYDLWRDPRQLTNVWNAPRYRDARRDLMTAWRRLSSCQGAACRVALPDSLQVGADQNRTETERWWRAIERVYGARG